MMQVRSEGLKKRPVHCEIHRGLSDSVPAPHPASQAQYASPSLVKKHNKKTKPPGKNLETLKTEQIKMESSLERLKQNKRQLPGLVQSITDPVEFICSAQCFNPALCIWFMYCF